MIRDGLSNTLLAGEKHVPVSKWGTGTWDSSIYNGDIYLSISRVSSPQHRIASTVDDLDWRFGSYHFGIIQFAFVMAAFEALLSIFPKKLSAGSQAEMMAKSYPITNPGPYVPFTRLPSVKSNKFNPLGKINKA